MRTLTILASAFLFLCGCSSVADERQAIAQALHQSLDKPTIALDIAPIVVRQNYAVAGWVQGDLGGRALLHRERSHWKIVAQAGKELRDAQFLKAAGMPQDEASALANMLITAERRVSEARLAQLDRYSDNNVHR